MRLCMCIMDGLPKEETAWKKNITTTAKKRKNFNEHCKREKWNATKERPMWPLRRNIVQASGDIMTTSPLFLRFSITLFAAVPHLHVSRVKCPIDSVSWTLFSENTYSNERRESICSCPIASFFPDYILWPYYRSIHGYTSMLCCCCCNNNDGETTVHTLHYTLSNHRRKGETLANEFSHLMTEKPIAHDDGKINKFVAGCVRKKKTTTKWHTGKNAQK